MDRKDTVKYAALGAILLLAVLWTIRNLTADTGPQDWYYDVSEARLFTAPRGSITPLAGVGGARGDGVEAIVIAPEGECGDAKARRIAYLVTYTAEYKRLKEEAARTGTRNQTAEKSFQAENTLVKRVEDADWSPATSEEGVRIIDEFNEMMMGTAGGTRWRPCMPG